jgi:FtsP/CotA-like multicopper oxidase with cupredoxin domain
MTRPAPFDATGRPAHPLPPFVDPLPVPPRRVVAEGTRLTVPIAASFHRFHRDLPPSPVWAFDSTVPGPTIETRRGVPVEVRWVNRIEGTLPVTVVRAPQHEVHGVPVQCLPGRTGGQSDPATAALRGFTVVHLHGALTLAVSDGWAENIALPGQSVLDTYPNDQRAALLWYHDHVMGMTRWSLFAGLAGLWIIRDEQERALGLPEGPPYEVPLLLVDRNFDTGSDGGLTGALLHKTDVEVTECFSPFTAVNGAIWPVLDVEPATYRFRVLNGSNARTYRLVLTRDGAPDHERITQIGSDGGLLPAATALPAQGLVLGSAERADLLVDFSDLSPGTELTLWNNAGAPFDGVVADPATAGTPDPENLLPFPEVLRIRVVDGQRRSLPAPPRPTTDVEPVDRAALAGCTVRAVALVEQETESEGAPPMLTMRELVEDHDGTEPVITVIERAPGDGAERVTRWRTVATRFEDTVTFFPMLGEPEIWRFVNLTEDTHPIHMHLDAFRVLDRHPAVVQVDEESIGTRTTAATVRIGEAPDDGIPHAVDANERGFKDTVRVNANEVVDIVVRFSAFVGRYMYHCHILEHEDHDMMRPFVVMPPELMPLMGGDRAHPMPGEHMPPGPEPA